MVAAIRHNDEKLRMPPGGRLSSAEVSAIETWIRDGAVWPDTKTIAAIGGDFWSLRPLSHPGGTIDAHVSARLAAEGLARNPLADKRTLLRRVSFDLTGLPPALREMSEFLADISTDAWARVVDRLLASPHFGERWGRHWLDLARFGEEDFTGTTPRFYPNAWRYRDWVVQAFNRDLPYDTFVKAQIAADLMNDSRDLIGGLGLFGFGPWYYSISQPRQARADERHDRVDMISRGFLGLTAACARCHDHKYEPISMRDYYGIAAVFANSKYEEYPVAAPEGVPRYKDAQAAIKAQEAKIAKFLDAQREQVADMFAQRIANAMIAMVTNRTAEEAKLDCELLDRWRVYLDRPEEEFPFLRNWHEAVGRKAPEQELRTLAESFQRLVIETAARKKEMDAENLAARNAAMAKAPKVRKIILPGGYDSEADFNPGADVPVKSLDREHMFLWRRFFEGRDALLRFDGAKIERFLTGPWKEHLALLRAELARLKRESPPAYGFHQGLAEHEERIDLPIAVRGNPFEDGEPVAARFPALLAGANARPWTHGSGRLELAEAIVASPIAARVMANRVWMHLFGAGIVSTPSNLGRSGSHPSNPELLEYLASRFVERGWSVKALIREIVMSETYRQSSAANSVNDAKDPGNTTFWRANRRRLDAEALRDAILTVTGDLDTRAGGESEALNESFRRRTIYARIGRYQQEETLTLFDFPSASVSAEKRSATNVPLQKLYLLNSPFFLDQSAKLARRTEREGIGRIYELLFGRAPDDAEHRLADDYLRGAGADGRKRYAQVLLSSNEFFFID